MGRFSKGFQCRNFRFRGKCVCAKINLRHLRFRLNFPILMALVVIFSPYSPVKVYFDRAKLLQFKFGEKNSARLFYCAVTRVRDTPTWVANSAPRRHCAIRTVYFWSRSIGRRISFAGRSRLPTVSLARTLKTLLFQT